MNSSALLTLQAEPPFYNIIFYYLFCPLLLGNIIDITFTKFAGPQLCSFNGTAKTCNIGGQTFPSFARELGRSLLQLTVLFFTIRYFSIYFKSSVFPIVGLSIFCFSQPELFEDFRRFINSLLFMIKHN